jgi:Zn-dependent protease with chaperone function
MGLLKAIGRRTYNVAYWAVLKNLRYYNYLQSLGYSSSLAITNMTLLCQDQEDQAKPLQEIARIDSFKSITPQILDLTKKLDLKPELIQVFLSKEKTVHPLPTMAAKAANGYFLILNDKELRNGTDTEKIAVIGHELVHVKDNYPLKFLCTSWVTPLILDIASSIFCPEYKVSDEHTLLMNIGLATCYGIVNSLIMRTIGRHFEKHADILAAEQGHCAEGLISFFKKSQKTYQQGKGSGPLSKLYTLAEFFDTHPTCAERIQYLTPIAEAQKQSQKFAEASN